MNPAYMHLLLNHIPVIGVPLATIVLAYGMTIKSDAVIRLAKLLFIGIALLTIPVFLSGDPAEDVIHNLPGFEKGMVHEHEEAGEFAFVVTAILGGASLLSLFFAQRTDVVNRNAPKILLVIAMVATGSLAYTSRLGGPIRHTEIRATQ